MIGMNFHCETVHHFMTPNGEVKVTLTRNIYTNKQDRCKACVPASLSVSDKQNYPPGFSGKYSAHFFSALERYVPIGGDKARAAAANRM